MSKKIRFGTDSMAISGETDTDVMLLHNGNMIIYQTSMTYNAEDNPQVSENIIFLRYFEVDKIVRMITEGDEKTE